MSRTSLVLLVIILALGGGGLAWYLTRTKPGELDIAAKNLPELPPPKIAAGDWPWWRGPTRDNHSPDAEAPTKWSEAENIVWKTPIPGRGHSTPILVGSRIFLTSADETAQTQFVICLDRLTGAKLWEKTVHEKNFPRKHGDNTYASATPASDGERLFVAFANNNAMWVTALDLDGKDILWRKEVGPHGGSGSHGQGSSPALWGSFVLISDDSPSVGWIAAVYRETGEVVWRKGRKTGIGSYGSPIVAELNGQPHLLLPGNGNVTAYNPLNGDTIWQQSGLGEVSANTVATSPAMVFASSGYPKRNLLALDVDGSVAWKKENTSDAPYPPSMIWTDGNLYAVSDQGLATCFNAQNGEQIWTERLRGNYYSSPLLVGSNIYACNRDGLTTIFEATPGGYSEIARNKLNGGINASPIVVSGKLYIRTESHMYCMGQNDRD